MQKILLENPRRYEAVKGDLLEFHFTILNFPVISTWHKNYIKGKIESEPHVRIKDLQYTQGDLMILIEVVENPLPLALFIGGVITILGGWFVWASLGRVYKVLKDPEIKSTINVAVLAVTAVIFVLVFKFAR